MLPTLVKGTLFSWQGALMGKKQSKHGLVRCAYFEPYGNRTTECLKMCGAFRPCI